jgi:hypothetical protein
MDFSSEMQAIGNKYKAALEARIDSGVPPPNAPATIMKKGHDLTLRDSWAYRSSIEVHTGPDFVEVGIFDPKIGEYVFANEHGTKTIPARPVFGPVADGPGEQFLDELETALADKIVQNF